jgi:hypothetical protein
MVDGQSVYARFVAYNCLGASLASGTDNGAIIPSPPPMPTGQCGVYTQDSVTISWVNGVNNVNVNNAAITSYQISYRQVGVVATPYTTFTISNSADTSAAFNNRQFTATGLSNGVEYDFTISATNAAGSSQPYVFQCRACLTPFTPTNLREDTTVRSVNRLGAIWDPVVNGAVGVTYTVTTSFRDDVGVLRQASSAGINGYTYDHDNLLPGREYTMSVQAVNICGASLSTSNLVLVAGSCPNPPTLVRTQSQVDQTVTCTWTNGDANGFPITGTEVYIAKQDGTYVNAAQYCRENQQQVARGVTGLTQVTNNVCTIPESTLRSSPFFLPE